MGNVLMVFSSSTTASRLKKLAFRNGINGLSIIQTPKVISKDGCTYSIKCDSEQLSFLKKLAEEYGIKYNNVFREFLDAKGNKMYDRY